MGTITFVLDWSAYSLITIATIINWDSIKGNVAFALGLILGIIRIYKYLCDVADRKAAKDAEKMRKAAEKLTINTTADDSEKSDPVV
jgi:succinate-acetate transporter protein